jgi:hypothetical protein
MRITDTVAVFGPQLRVRIHVAGVAGNVQFSADPSGVLWASYMTVRPAQQGHPVVWG